MDANSRMSEPVAGSVAAEPGCGAQAAAPTGARVDPGYARGVVLVALAGVFWSVGGLLIRLIEAAGAWQIVLFRALALALTLTLIIALRHRGRLLQAFGAAGWNGVAAGVALSGGFIGWVLALHHTTVANATFMLGASPFFGALLGRLVLGEPLRRATALAMAVALAGVLVMVGGGLVLGTIRGNLLALGACLSFAIFSVLLRRGREHDMLPCGAIAGAVSALIALPVVLAGAASIGDALLLTPRDLALCAIMGAVQVGGGLTVFTLGARHVPVAELTLLSLTELALAPIWVWLAVGEVPSGYTLLGGAIIVVAITYQALSGARRRRPLPMV
jgi:drug/metabolite transporter (DMT)-like permease